MIFYKKFKSLLRPVRTRFRILFFGLYSSKWYPISIKELHSKVDIKARNSFEIEDLANLLKRINLKNKDTVSKICLAGTTLELEKQKIFWKQEIVKDLDSEFDNALYRFHWMLEETVKNEDKNEVLKFIQIMQSWFYSYRKSAKSIAFQPYNTSERICNLTIFLLTVYRNHLLSEEELRIYQEFIAEDLAVLKDSLEYPASGVVNNHILNNARALMIGGFFIGNSDLIALAKGILRLHLPKMINKNGYLEESSSHYQLLLTRSLIEISLISEILLDQDFFDWVNDYTQRMFLASSRLEPKEDNYKSHFPNIGDVSPDIPLNWFSIRGDLLSGWNKLWKKTYLFHNKAPILSEDEGWVVLKKGDWFSINFSHKSNKNYPDGHGHEDFGSFLLYFKGRQLLTDIGRFTYDDELETFSGKEESSHSVVLSNDLISKSRNSFFRRHGILEDQVIRDFRQCKQILNWETRNRKYFWNRTLEISEKKVNIADKINTESAKSFFYLSPDCQVKSINKNKIIVGLESVGNFEFEFIGIKNMSVKEVNFFPSYGIKKKTLRIGCEIPSENKPCKIETLIRKL